MWQLGSQDVVILPESVRRRTPLRVFPADQKTAVEQVECRSLRPVRSRSGLTVRVCHTALALYLLPVFGLVLALGVVLLAVTEVARLFERATPA